MATYEVASKDELAEGERIVVQHEGLEIAVFNHDGEYYAYSNWCAHQGGPICEGPLTGTMSAEFDRESLKTELEWSDEGKILNCPWHAWEYDITTGECLSWDNVSLPSYPVEVEGETIVVEI